MGRHNRLSKDFTKEFDIGMRVCFLLLGSILFTTVTVSLLFLVKLSIGFYSFPLSIGFLLLVYTIFLYDKNDLKRYFIPIIIALLIGTAAVLASSYIWDTSWDGWMYHIPASIEMAEGWNPIYEHSDAVNIYEPYTPEQEHILWVQHYPKFIWIYAAALYKFTGMLYSGSSITLIIIVCTFLITIDIFKKSKKIPKYLVYIIGIIVSLNTVIITQLFTFYNDGLLGNIVVCLILILFGIAKGYYSYKNNLVIVFFVAFFVCFLTNIKLTGALYAAVILALFFLYFFATKIITKKDQFTKYFAGFVLLITLIVGSNSYLINLIYHKNIGYPIVGKEKVDIILNNTPFILQFDDKYEAFVASLTSDTYHGFDRVEYLYKPAFIITRDELVTIANTTDPRLAGYGPSFQLILWAVLLIIFASLVKRILKVFSKKEQNNRLLSDSKSKKNKSSFIKRYSSELMLVLVFSVLIIITPNIWWARYLPFFYTFPLLCFALFNTKWDKANLINILGSFIIMVYLISSLVYTSYSVAYAVTNSNNCRHDLQYYKEQSIKAPINIAFYNYNLFLYKIPVVTHMFEKNGIDYHMYSEDESVVSGYRSFTLGIDMVEPLSPKNKVASDMLRKAKDGMEYFDILAAHKNDFIIIVSVKDEASIHIQYLEKSTIGFEKLTNLDYKESYIAVIDGQNDFFYENISAEAQTYTYLGMIEIQSAGFSSGNLSQVLYKGAQYSKNERGLNVCVFDAETLTIIDSVHIDTYGDIDLGVRRW